MNNDLSVMLGKTFADVVMIDKDVIKFIEPDGSYYMFYHEQDCCESVYVEDINGDLSDLVSSPLLVAEESSNKEEQEDGSCTWTFYKFATIKGSVDVRWYGGSNGYYSEMVYFQYIKAKEDKENE